MRCGFEPPISQADSNESSLLENHIVVGLKNDIFCVLYRLFNLPDIRGPFSVWVKGVQKLL